MPHMVECRFLPEIERAFTIFESPSYRFKHLQCIVATFHIPADMIIHNDIVMSLLCISILFVFFDDVCYHMSEISI